MKISVLIPTYRRPQDLLRCLKALSQQTRLADQVVVTVRNTDTATWKVLQTVDSLNLPLEVADVTVPGVIAAMNAGLKLIKGELFAMTDDDSVPFPEWLERIEHHFLADAQVGGVGGRDYVYHGDIFEDGMATEVGTLSWFGRVIGNHHIGTGDAREVDVLKGVNMSFRRSAIASLKFDERMKGKGAQVHFELAFCLALKNAGWKLIYDPMVAVNHYPAIRFDTDQRRIFNPEAYENAVHNETLALLDALSAAQRLVFIVWAVVIGTRQSFGLLQAFRFQFSEKAIAYQKLWSSIKGRWSGWMTWKNTKSKCCASVNLLN